MSKKIHKRCSPEKAWININNDLHVINTPSEKYDEKYFVIKTQGFNKSTEGGIRKRENKAACHLQSLV